VHYSTSISNLPIILTSLPSKSIKIKITTIKAHTIVMHRNRSKFISFPIPPQISNPTTKTFNPENRRFNKQHHITKYNNDNRIKQKPHVTKSIKIKT